jgi:hypothetical protein
MSLLENDGVNSRAIIPNPYPQPASLVVEFRLN